MINPYAHEVFARQRQQELLQTAVQVRRARHLRRTRPHRLRTRAGWWMVQAGIRLVLSDSPQVLARNV